MPKRLVLICRASRRSLKLFLVTVCDPGGVEALHMVSERTCDRDPHQWMESPWQSPSGAKILGVNRQSRGLISWLVSEA